MGRIQPLMKRGVLITSLLKQTKRPHVTVQLIQWQTHLALQGARQLQGLGPGAAMAAVQLFAQLPGLLQRRPVAQGVEPLSF